MLVNDANIANKYEYLRLHLAKDSIGLVYLKIKMQSIYAFRLYFAMRGHQ